MVIQLKKIFHLSLVIVQKKKKKISLRGKTLGKQELALFQMPDFLTSIVNNFDHTSNLSTTQIPGL